MKRFAQIVMLKDDPEIIRQYEEYDANPWPEVIEGGRRIGWDALMRTFQEPVSGAPEGSTWVQMKEIYAWEAS
jgi:L-rhamnose mutarotase